MVRFVHTIDPAVAAVTALNGVWVSGSIHPACTRPHSTAACANAIHM
jgi:hypothetical protein